MPIITITLTIDVPESASVSVVKDHPVVLGERQNGVPPAAPETADTESKVRRGRPPKDLAQVQPAAPVQPAPPARTDNPMEDVRSILEGWE